MPSRPTSRYDRIRRRRAMPLIVGLVLVATVGCSEYQKDDASTTTTEAAGTASGDIPTRAEFVAAIRETQSDMFTSNVEGMGLDPAKASDVYDAFIGCTYDEIKDQPELVLRATDPNAAADTELDAQLQQLAAACQETFNADMRELLAALPTTTVAP